MLFKLFKLLLVLLVLGFVGLTGYAYFGDLTPQRSEVRTPLTVSVD